jgi:septal ring factor EnvC (AmiA/AmiB activator)
MEVCKFEQEIGAMKETLDRHKKVLEGNGQKGVISAVTELNVRLKINEDRSEELCHTMSALSEKISSISDFKKEIEVTTTEKERAYAKKKESSRDTKWIIGLGITIIPYIIMFIQWLKN